MKRPLAFFDLPGPPSSDSAAEDLIDTIETLLSVLLNFTKAKRIDTWKSNVPKSEKLGWKLLGRCKLLAPVNYFQNEEGDVLYDQALFDHIAKSSTPLSGCARSTGVPQSQPHP